MSGIEVIGLVLGILPLVISAGENYKKGFEPLVRWKRFKFVFRDFITSVDIQRQMFQLVSKKLLIRVQLPPDEKRRLLTVPNYEGWTQPETIEAIRLRLGDSYDVCMEILRAMKTDLMELQEMMSLKNGSVDWAHPGEKQWKYQAKRLQLSFSENGTRTVESLEKKIHRLKDLLDLLDSTDDEDSYTENVVPKDTSWAELFKRIRRYALNLHSAIKGAWKCNCEGIHTAGLQLQKRKAHELSSQFTMTFGALSSSPNHQLNPSPHHRVLILLKESTGQPVSQRPKPFPVQISYIDQLRSDFEAKTSSELNINKLSIHTASSSISSRFNSVGSMFTRSHSNSASSSISMSSGTEIVVERNAYKYLSPLPKPKKQISFAMDFHRQADDIMGAETSIAVSNQSISLPAVPSATTYRADAEIKDLCSTLKGVDPTTTGLGYLFDHEKQKHELSCLTQKVEGPESLDLISLDKLLAIDGSLRLTSQERYKVASVLASSVLQLQTTPWLNKRLSKDSIFFYHDGDNTIVDQPYISHSFPSVKSRNKSSGSAADEDRNNTPPRESLSNLGILLLELCCNQAIENQTDLRKRHLSSDGQAIGGTDYLTAIDWLDTVQHELEPKMLPIIKWCIFCLFEGKPNWADMKFTQAAYVNVVRPLEMLVAAQG